MDKNNDNFHKKKLEHIKKNYEMLYSLNNRLRQQAFTLRGWCITLLIGYASFVISRNKNTCILAIIALIIPVFFWILEGFLESNCHRVKLRMKEIDKMFDNEQNFYDAVKKYSFPLSYERDVRGRFVDFKAALKAGHLIAWYSIMCIIPVILIIYVTFF